MSPKLSIIIPVRREEESIAQTIRQLEHSVKIPHITIIADDTIDRSDKTLTAISRLSLDCRKAVRIFRKKAGDQDGFGPALTRAMRKVTTPYTAIVMADLCDDPKTIDLMMKTALAKNLDIVCGCRYMRGGKKIGGPWIQGVLSAGLNSLLYYIGNVPTRDATNAFKLYRTSFLQSIVPKAPETGVEFSLQLILEAVKKHPKTLDVPTVWRGREKGRSKVKLFSRGPKYLRLVLRYIF